MEANDFIGKYAKLGIFFFFKLRVIFWFGAKLLNFRALSKKKLRKFRCKLKVFGGT